MAGYQRVIFNGDPGDRWRNTTGKVQYQLLVNWANTCGVCAQYDHAIGPIWPLPYHRNCRCRQIAIPPEALAEPWVDFRAIADGLDLEGKRALVGASNYRLIQAGTVAWSDVVTPHRVRDLHEVVAIKKLSVDRLTAAGIRPAIAEAAHATVHTPEHQLIEAQRRRLVANLAGAGLDRATLASLAAEGLAARVVVSGPSGRQKFDGLGIDDRLRRFLAAWRPKPPKPEPKLKPEETPGPDDQAGDGTAIPPTPDDE
ncbi:hypothetical protein [Paludisphaera rhizosphaerae]|uniref:hypothetical protein n=1 Tax=Paludisphaera rhizosphaerae TaxID=2711216 RepID=UPI0013EA8289|nr:hypothetical protein [Paludisphaera rhizosphaerae]